MKSIIVSRLISIIGLVCSITLNCNTAQALPTFARQTGQSCIACHAGGQFPELTPYGRIFKLTGYTMGNRTNPFAAMVVTDVTKAANNMDPNANKIAPLNNQVIFDFASVFVAGKINENLGGFSQFTYSAHNYIDDSCNWQGHVTSDNFDLRFVQRDMDLNKDLITGLTLHNNPGVQDVWNTTPAWGYPYVSTTTGAFGGMPIDVILNNGTLASQVAGLGAYAMYNKTIYIELTEYTTANRGLKFLSGGYRTGDTNNPLTYTQGTSPYLRLTLSHEWNAHNIMFGLFGLNTSIYPLDPNTALPQYNIGVLHYQDRGIDAQYQYLLEPHAFTAQLRATQENIHDDTQQNYLASARLNSYTVKASYVYNATYGMSLSFKSVKGSPDSQAYASDGTYASGLGNSPNSILLTPEIFWMPVQNIRIGLQYNNFKQYLGASSNYDGNQRNASDNNSAFVYAWLAF